MSSAEDREHRSEAPSRNGGAAAGEPVTGTVTVCFPDFDAARRAIEELEASGVEATNIAVEDDSLDRAKGSDDSGRRDSRFVARAGRKFRKGALVGVVVGAVAGAALGFFAVGGGALVGVGALTLVTAVVGGLVGGAVSGIWNHPQSAAWEESLEAPAAGDACLRITIADEDQSEVLSGVMQERGGWFDSEEG